MAFTSEGVWVPELTDGSYETKISVDGVEYFDGIQRIYRTRSLFSQQTLSFGGCYSSSLEVTFKYDKNVAIGRNAKVEVYTRQLSNDPRVVNQWKKQGEYFISRRYPEDDLLTLTCYDAIMKLNKTYTHDGLTWPAKMSSVVEGIAERFDISLDPSTTFEEDYTIENPPVEYTYREVLSYIAGAHAGNFIINNDGLLSLVKLPNPEDGIPLDPESHGKLTGTVKYNPVTKVILGREEDELVCGMSDLGVVKIKCPFATQEICDRVYDTLFQYEYLPFNVDNAQVPLEVNVGDVLEMGGVKYWLITCYTEFGSNMISSISAPYTSEEPDEFDMMSPSEIKDYRDKIQLENKLIDISEAIGSATDWITGGLGGYVYLRRDENTGIPYEIVVLDEPNLAEAKSVWRFNKGGLGHSSNGYGGPYEVALTPEGGIMANLMVGILRAELIKAGVLSSADGKTFVLDLEKGTLSMEATSLKIAGKTVEEIADEKVSIISEDLSEFESLVTGSLEDLQAQVDGQIQTWFDNYVPTTDNAPANTWESEEDRVNHLGDIFYIVDNETSGGQAYRWANVSGEYKWVLIEDVEVAKALADAAKAQDTADGKRRVFVSTPVPPYDVGDLWSQGSNGDLMRCNVARSNGSYTPSDWGKASSYINGDEAEGIASGAVEAQTQMDIFNKLTDNGKLQGLYMQDGKLYINAEYLAAGKISSKDGSSIWDLVNGTISLMGTFTSKSQLSTLKAELNQGALRITDGDKQVVNIGASLGASGYSGGVSLFGSNGKITDLSLTDLILGGKTVITIKNGGANLQANDLYLTGRIGLSNYTLGNLEWKAVGQLESTDRVLVGHP